MPPAAVDQSRLSPAQVLALQSVAGNRAASLYIARTRSALTRFPSPAPTAVKQPLTTIPAGGNPVDQIGVVGWDGTPKLALHSSPDDTRQNILTFFDFGTRLQVIKSFPGAGWYYVSTSDGLTGYTKSAHVLTDLPEPGARLHVVKSGKPGYAIEIAKHYFPGAHWGADERFYVNVIAWANRVHVPDTYDGWKELHFNAGRRIWVPSQEFALTLRGKVNSGSLSYEMLDALGLADFVYRLAELLRDFSTAIDKSKQYMGDAIERHVDEAIVDVIGGLVTMMVGAIAILAVSTAVGAALGALFGGVGAAPGAAIGAEVGTALLEWLGLGFLVTWILEAVTSVVSAFATFVSSVWDARGDQKKLDLAGKDFAEAIGTLIGETIEALVAWLAAEGLEAGMTKLRESSFGQKLSGKFFDWLKDRAGGKRRKRLEDEERGRKEREEEQKRKQQELDAERKRLEDEERARKERELEQERRRQEEDRQREEARKHEDEQRKREAERQREREEEEKRHREADAKRRKQQAEQARQRAEQAKRQAEQQREQQHRQQSQQQQARQGGPGKPKKGDSGGGGKPRELTDDEKWEQAKKALKEQESATSGGEVIERYPTPEAAIGQVEGKARVIDRVRTENAGLRAQGFTETWYVEDANGTQWTVAHNPRTGEFTGAHHSSSN
jgi:phosphate/sulfate permease